MLVGQERVIDWSFKKNDRKSQCTTARSNKEFVKSLLCADSSDFVKLTQNNFVRKPSKSSPLRFLIKENQSQKSADWNETKSEGSKS